MASASSKLNALIPSMDTSYTFDASTRRNLVEEAFGSALSRDSTTITQVEWMRSSTGIGHESLRFIVKAADPPHIASFTIERCTDLEAVEDALNQDRVTHFHPASVFSSMDRRQEADIKRALSADFKAEATLISDRRAPGLIGLSAESSVTRRLTSS